MLTGARADYQNAHGCTVYPAKLDPSYSSILGGSEMVESGVEKRLKMTGSPALFYATSIWLHAK
ncbi:hypothetical protein KaCgl_11460 [Corynebacterium glutamicum]|nr:hypothetical protein KaCgl_11460 [Corynebacterium glutamicum]